MKQFNKLSVLILSIVIAIGTTGCKGSSKKTATVTPLPNPSATVGSGTSSQTDTGVKVPQIGGTPSATDLKPLTPADLPDPKGLEGMEPDREFFKAQTVYFDFDRSTIKDSEKSKIDYVAKYLKENLNTKIQIEGHCDERGTEEYNRSLGERRALAIREYLIHSGVDGSRIYTISYGEDKPVDPGHNEAAWAKNRRGEFVLYRPKQ